MRDPELLTSHQVLELLQIGRTKLWDLVKRGGLPAYRIGEGRNATLRFRRGELESWIDRNRVPGTRPLLAVANDRRSTSSPVE